jgi:CxxC motif-containing protein
MGNRELICISCPLGCRLTVKILDGDSSVEVRGNRCPRGEVYGREEVLRPKRMVTATMATDNAEFPRIPVKSASPVPRERIPDILNRLYALKVSLPASAGDVLADIDGISFVSTRTLGK